MGKWFSLVHLPTNTIVAKIQRADSWLARGIGVLGKSGLPEGEGLWLPGVASVHTCGVRFPLDICFFDHSFKAVRFVPNVAPWTPLVRASGATHTIELAGGEIARSGLAWADGEQWEAREIAG